MLKFIWKWVETIVNLQTINRDLNALVEEGIVNLRYGKIYLADMDGMQKKYKHLLGGEQIAAPYGQDTRRS